MGVYWRLNRNAVAGREKAAAIEESIRNEYIRYIIGLANDLA